MTCANRLKRRIGNGSTNVAMQSAAVAKNCCHKTWTLNDEARLFHLARSLRKAIGRQRIQATQTRLRDSECGWRGALFEGDAFTSNVTQTTC